MGMTAENVAEQYGITRERMDEFAKRSQDLAVEAQKNGFFEREITPVVLPDGRSAATDDGPRPNTTIEKLASLEPVFKPGGTVTAGNSCPLNDGAAAVLVMEESKARAARAHSEGEDRRFRGFGPGAGDHGGRADRGGPKGPRPRPACRCPTSMSSN